MALSLILFFGLLAGTLGPIVSYADESVVYIDSKEDFISFANNCSYDLWSRGKTFVLTSDISLEDSDISPIPTFSGTFDGQGHVISGFKTNGAYSPCGLFSVLEGDGIIKNLTVTGSISPDGSASYVGGIVGDNSGVIEGCVFVGTIIAKQDVGGIAGINRTSGSISKCTTGGEVIAENRGGGIVGSNEGLISSCLSNTKVNTVAVTPEITLGDISLTISPDLTKIPSINTLNQCDIGGIAGYNTGMILGSTNNGKVGYPHVGYNIGGITGRNSGHLSSNINNGAINGRKDVGGIVGQMEPFVDYKLSEDLLSALRTELDALTKAVGVATEKAGGTSSSLAGKFDSILDELNAATDSLNTLINNGTNYGDGIVDEVNRVSAVLGEAMTQLSAIASDIPAIAKLLSEGLSGMEGAMNDLGEIAGIGMEAISDLILAAEDLASAFTLISSATDKITEGARMLEESLVIQNSDDAKDALAKIGNGLYDCIDAVDGITNALSSVSSIMQDNAWMDDAIAQAEELAISLGGMSDALLDIYTSVGVIIENVDIHWEKLVNAGEEAVYSVRCFADAMANLDGSLELMENGLNKVIDGLSGISNAMKIKDDDAVIDSAKTLAEGFTELGGAISETGESFIILSEALAKLNDGGALTDFFGDFSEALGHLGTTGGASADAFLKISLALSSIFSNVTIDFNIINDNLSLIVGGTADLYNSLGKMRSAIKSMSLGMNALNNAIDALTQSVTLDDSDAISLAIEDICSAFDLIVSSVNEMGEAIGAMSDTFKSAVEWSEDLGSAFGDAIDSLDMLSDSIVAIRDGFVDLSAVIELDFATAKDGLGNIASAISDFSDAAAGIGSAFTHLSGMMTSMESASEPAIAVAIQIAGALASFGDAMEKGEDMAQKIEKLMSYLAGIDPIQIAKPSESITATANDLFIHISSIEKALKSVNSDSSILIGDMIDFVDEINEIFSRICDDIIDIIYGLEDGISIDTTVSEKEINEVTNGKVYSSTNNGSVSGDINVGGISGSVGLEIALDPEDDLSIELSVTQKMQYRLKAVIHNCKNVGNVQSKYDCAGGIAGKADFGIIYGCESYCDVESLSGSYVGGIAGLGAGMIAESYAKCTLAGSKYVGGIIGCGVDEDFSGESSLVKNCYSMVKISSAEQFAGAIAGVNIGKYENNLFISDSLAGIDRISSYGKAEPISYEDLLKRRSIPDEFCHFKLTFFADGIVISSIDFEYGASFGPDSYPEIPAKAGHYGRWDVTSLENLTFDTKVNVVYQPYTTAISSDEKRDDGREIFFARGEFTDTDKIGLTLGAGVDGLALVNKLFSADSLIESFILTLPSDNLDTNVLHFLPTQNGCRIFVRQGGEWIQVETGKLGSYITFEIGSDVVEIAVVRHRIKILPIVIPSVLALGGIVWLAIYLSKKNKAEKAAVASGESSSSDDKKSIDKSKLQTKSKK